MDEKDFYSSKIDVISAIPDDKIMSPVNMPVSVYIQEAEDLFTWCQPDKEKLTANGLQWELVEDLPARIDTLREAQGRWENSDLNDLEVERIWSEKLPAAQELRKELIRAMKFVFYNSTSRLDKIEKFSEGFSSAAMIQSLRGLALFGKEHLEELKASKFDVTKLDTADAISRELGSLLGAVHARRAYCSDSLKIRNQAYTHLREAIAEIKRHADYVLCDEPARLKGYTSSHGRKRYLKNRNKKNQQDNDNLTDTEE